MLSGMMISPRKDAETRSYGFMMLTENEISRQIVDAAYKIHTTLGPGLLESVYEALMVYELRKRGLQVKQQQTLPVRSLRLCAFA